MIELGPDAREILRNGRDGDEPLPADRARIHSALMATIAAGAATTMAASANASTAGAGADLGLPASVGAAKPLATALFGSVFAKGMLILFCGAAGMGAWLAWPAMNSRPAPIEPPVVDKPAAAALESMTALPLTTPPLTTPPLTRPPENTPLETLLKPPTSAAAPVLHSKPMPVRVIAAAPAPKPHEEAADSLVVETQRLREAHGALRAGDPEKALALLSEQAAEVEGQKLREERAAARVLALCKLGRVDEAHADAASFLAQNPHSPLADRVRNACSTDR